MSKVKPSYDIRHLTLDSSGLVKFILKCIRETVPDTFQAPDLNLRRCQAVQLVHQLIDLPVRRGDLGLQHRLGD